MLKGYTRKQQMIPRSSTEAELYAAVFGASDAEVMVSLFARRGLCNDPNACDRCEGHGTRLAPTKYQTNEAH